MENVEAKVRQLQQMFERVAKSAPTIIGDEEGIQIANGFLVISSTEVASPRLMKKPLMVPAFELLTNCVEHAEDTQLDKGYVSICVEKHFDQIAKAAVMTFLEDHLDAYLEFLDTEREAKELFGNGN